MKIASVRPLPGQSPVSRRSHGIPWSCWKSWGTRCSYPPGTDLLRPADDELGLSGQARASVEALGEALLQEPCDAVVAPAASCVVAARENLERLTSSAVLRGLAAKIYELTEFLHDVAPSTPR